MRGQTSNYILVPKLQCKLRKASTDAERALWRRLRNRLLGNFKFRRQHPYEQYILDFVCLERMLVVEADGGQHRQSIDESRDESLIHAGFRILRFWNNDILQHTDDVLAAILEALRDQNHPHPGPPLEGEGEEHELSGRM